MSSNYHFCAVRPVEDLILSAEHKLSGRVAQYLRDFQLDGIRFLYKHFENNESCILNDESGLGKTATVCAFLETVLPHDATRNCLIIVKNDERVKNWKFHLEALTKLPNKVVFRNEDVSNGIVFLTKWDSFQKSASLAKHVFDCVIIDNRGELLANKICSGYLLRNYVNKISLIVSSADVAIDLRQFHMMLKMCGRLGKAYEDIKIFEEKFALPSTSGSSEDINLLEAYFLRRERIINFCREFRLRRYRHQYDDVLPLAQPDDYIKSLNVWITTPTCYSKSSSSSVKILSSSSEKDAEQLLKSYFVVKEQRETDEAEGKLNKIARVSTGFNDDDDDMPPLLLESDSEERCADRFKRSRKTRPIAFAVDVQIKDVNCKTEPKWKQIHGENCAIKTPTKGRKKPNAANISSVRTNMRSIHATRSKTQKNKYLLFGHNIQDKKKSKIRKQIMKSETVASNNIEKSRMRKQYMKTEAENVETFSYNKYSTRSRTKISCKVFDNLDKLNKKKGVRNNVVKGNNVVSHQKCQATKNNIKSTKGITKAKKKIFEKKAESQKSNSAKNVLKILPKKTKGTIIRTCIKATDTPRCGIQKEVLFDSPQDDVIVLSSSTDNCTPLSRSNSIKAFQTAASLLSSPDIFSNVTDDCDILCSQRDKLHGSRFTTSSSFRKTETTILRNSNSSCLDLLEKEFSNEKSNRLQENERVLEKNFIQFNEEISEVTPVKGRSVTSQKNKITKYLIGSEPTNQRKLLQLAQHEHLEDNTKFEENPKTPKKPKIARRNVNTFHNSPKTKVPKDITPNSLKTWLLKSQTTHEDTVKLSKRRRLDLWFND